MQSHALAGEERVGLGLAIAAHAALLALIIWHPPMAAPVRPPERITVTLSDDVGLTSTSPEPNAAAAPDMAPVLGEQPPVAARHQVVPPRPVAEAVPQPRPTPQVAPRPRPALARPDIIAELTSRAPAQRVIPRPAGGSRIGNDFLKGVPGAQASGASQNQPAAAIGPAIQSSLAGAISRQLKPHWAVPQGADADKLVTILTWSLNRDGTLAGPPRVVRQEGINDSNRPQAALHAEQAIRAVQLAVPFQLPAEYYDAWKRVAAFRFDRRL